MSIPAARPEDAGLAVLAERVQAGDRDAESDLIERILPGITAIATVRLRSRDRAPDVAQETALALIEALRAGRLREPAKVAAFAHGILLNVIRARYRDEKVERLTDPVASEQYGETAPDPVQAGEERRLLRKALATLDAIDRRILVATLAHGLTPAEIGQRLGLSAELVRTRKSRAIKKVAEIVRRMTRPPSKRYIRE